MASASLPRGHTNQGLTPQPQPPAIPTNPEVHLFLPTHLEKHTQYPGEFYFLHVKAKHAQSPQQSSSVTGKNRGMSTPRQSRSFFLSSFIYRSTYTPLNNRQSISQPPAYKRICTATGIAERIDLSQMSIKIFRFKEKKKILSSLDF